MLLCVICNEKFKNQNSLAGHINGNHKEFIKIQKNVVCKMKGYGKSSEEILNNIIFTYSFIRSTVKDNKELIDFYKKEFAEELCVKYKNGISVSELSEKYKILPPQIRKYLNIVLSKKEMNEISKNIKNNKISITLTGKRINCNKRKKVKKMYEIICGTCKNKFNHENKKRQFCDKICSTRHSGLASAKAQANNRRSKNEIYFSELCEEYFEDIKTNEPIFNGWDADIIIEDIKIAVLWNGKWHYEKITKKHSVEQVQNRDRIKMKEIEKCGYKYYIIKDMGRENKEFVKEQFDLFIKYIKEKKFIVK